MVQGEVDDGARRFLGIPFAAPPVGELRWRPPAPVIPWQGVRDATAFGARCAQRTTSISAGSEDEDCLSLNVWAPDPAPPAPLPVMVWFHGGGNETGSASEPLPFGLEGLSYDGRVLTETRNVIVVTTNYRVGIFGFFAHSALTAEDPANTGNQGLLDQRAALEWVRKNIVAFGGDPDNVTIFGESAGGYDTCLHLVSPGSRGLFHRAIAESPGAPTGHGTRTVPGPGTQVVGACTNRLQTVAEAESKAESVLAAVGCTGTDDVLACLRSVSVADLLEAAGTDFGVAVDGHVVPDQPRTLLDAGDFARVPYILGTNADEGTFFFFTSGLPPVTTEAEYLVGLRALYGDLADDVAAVYPAAAFASPQDALARAFGDSAMVCPTYENARRAAAGGADVYLYNFARVPPLPLLEALKLGATHTVEIHYVFRGFTLPTATDEALSEAIQGYWTRFALTGDPNGEGAVTWPRYEPASDQRLNLDAEITVVSGFRRPECEFWWGVYDAEFNEVTAAR